MINITIFRNGSTNIAIKIDNEVRTENERMAFCLPDILISYTLSDDMMTVMKKYWRES